jgi:tripartite-type tricarboxylate transporter receptor subunit TctC
MRLAISLWLFGCLLLTACQPAAPSPTTKPADSGAAKPAESPAAKPAGSPDAKPAASPAASPAAAAQPAESLPPVVNVDVEDAARYFNGKTITVTVGFAPGGGYDTFARIMAAYWPNHIPGNPKMVVTNLPGGGSLTAWQNVMRKAPGTGLDIAVFSGGLLTQAVLGEKLEAFDPDIPIYIGAPDFAQRRSTLCVRTDTANSLESFLKLNKKTRIAEASQATGPGAFKKWLELIGLPVQAVYGYGGTSELNAAFDKGELDLSDRCDDANLATFPHWISENMATPLFYLERQPDFIAPLLAQGKYPWYGYIFDVIKVTPDQRMAFDMNNRLSTGERLFALPPRTPDNVANALTKSFYDTVADPEFRNAAVARNYDVGLKTGETLRQLIAEVKTLNPEVQSLLQQMYAINK